VEEGDADPADAVGPAEDPEAVGSGAESAPDRAPDRCRKSSSGSPLDASESGM
jgi:hypothetical protein